MKRKFKSKNRYIYVKSILFVKRNQPRNGKERFTYRACSRTPELQKSPKQNFDLKTPELRTVREKGNHTYLSISLTATTFPFAPLLIAGFAWHHEALLPPYQSAQPCLPLCVERRGPLPFCQHGHAFTLDFLAHLRALPLSEFCPSRGGANGCASGCGNDGCSCGCGCG
jgi:hypothetical protein